MDALEDFAVLSAAHFLNDLVVVPLRVVKLLQVQALVPEGQLRSPLPPALCAFEMGPAATMLLAMGIEIQGRLQFPSTERRRADTPDGTLVDADTVRRWAQLTSNLLPGTIIPRVCQIWPDVAKHLDRL